MPALRPLHCGPCLPLAPSPGRAQPRAELDVRADHRSSALRLTPPFAAELDAAAALQHHLGHADPGLRGWRAPCCFAAPAMACPLSWALLPNCRSAFRSRA